MEEKKQPMITDDMQMLIAGIMPNTRYFDSRFDLLQVQIDGLQKGQDETRNLLQVQINGLQKGQDETRNLLQVEIDGLHVEITGLKESQNETKERIDRFEQRVDKRFEQVITSVDKRFDQVITSIDRLTDKLDNRDDKQRNFTLRMFTIAISISIIGVCGAFLKSLGII